MATVQPHTTSFRLTPLQWLIAIIAAIGFAFDTYALLMLPLIVRPALLELTGAAPGSPGFNDWVGRLCYIPAFAGGIFGLLGGYLTDLFGPPPRARLEHPDLRLRRRSPSGFSTSVECCSFWRCCTFVGVCVEFVAAVAWLAELFPEPEAARGVARLHAGVRVARRPAWSPAPTTCCVDLRPRACRLGSAAAHERGATR